MKKIIVLVMMVLSLLGCNMSNTPSDEVERYLDNFNNLSDEVIMDVDSKVSMEELNNENKEIYKKVLLRQYENMKYEITDESIEKNTAMVKANITVYDYYKINDLSNIYMNEHVSEFNNINGIFDNDKYNSYRLNELLNTNDTTTYEVIFSLKKDSNGNWIMSDPSRETLEKLNGFYVN